MFEGLVYRLELAGTREQIGLERLGLRYLTLCLPHAESVERGRGRERMHASVEREQGRERDREREGERESESERERERVQS